MKIRVLLVDQTAFVRDALKRALWRFLKDVEIFDAVNGHRAVAVLRANPITLIISEWDMEEMSGFEFLQHVRKDERTAKTPFIVMSDGGDREVVMNAINAGANDILAKPFTSDDVQKKVLKQLSRVGYKPKEAGRGSQNSGFGSVEVYDGGLAPPPLAGIDAVASGKSSSIKKPAQKSPAKPKAANALKHFKGRAQIQFADYAISCSINELSKAGIVGSIARSEQNQLPRIFDTGSADIENSDGHTVGSMQVYVFAMQAAQPSPEASSFSVKLRFVDEDAQGFAKLSEAIANS